MANSRIKDIATTATFVADDDYLVIDGATNGTRKIKADKALDGQMYDYTLYGGSAMSSFSSLTRKLVVGDNSLITLDNLLSVRVYGVSDTDGVVVFGGFQLTYLNTDSLILSSSQGTSRSFVIHVVAPFQITSDSAYM